MNHTGTRRMETERLILRRYTVDDAPAMYANWACDPVVTEYLTWPPHASADLTRQLLTLWVSEYDEPSRYNWVLELKSDGTIIGNLSVVRVNDDICEVELGWCLGAKWWGKGYMPEAARAALAYLFNEVGVNRVSAKHDVDNPKSGRVMQKIGMRFEGVRRQGFKGNRGVVDVACYAILKSDAERADHG